MARTEWLSEGAERLSSELLRKQGFHCDIAIVGSGYGGAVAAARLAGLRDATANRNLDVWVLERGREHVPGSFPERLADLPAQVRFNREKEKRGARGLAEGLFDLRIGEDVSTLLANGLGGGSLINAGVLARPGDSVFRRSPWPWQIADNALDPFFARVEETLGQQKLHGPAPAKLASLEELGSAIEGKRCDRRANLAVSFRAGANAAGVTQGECIRCGDCFTGCNHWAKNTLAMNYLPLALRRGARLFTGATVLSVREIEHGWELAWEFTDAEIKKRFGAPAPMLRAHRVVLAAGAYGSTGILLRSRRRGFLSLSRQLGERFSTNGDMLAVAYRMPEPVRASAEETVPPQERDIGPTITGVLDLRGEQPALVIEELAIPAALRRVFEEVVTTSATLHKLDRFDWSRHGPAPGADPAAIDPEAIARTAVYATMGDDDAGGRIKLQPSSAGAEADDGVRVDWPDVGRHPVFHAAIDRLERAHAGSGALVMPNPLWRLLPSAVGGVLDGGEIGGSVFTVHPLGGCGMAERAEEGVVNRFGQVFSSTRGNAVHDGLVVLDGSIVPTALGINPCLTIAALAEYAVAGLARTWNLTEDPALQLRPLPLRPLEHAAAGAGGSSRWADARPTSFRIAERLNGKLDLPVARGTGGAASGQFDAALEIEYEPVPDLEKFLWLQPKLLRLAKGRLRLTGSTVQAPDATTAMQATLEVDGCLWMLEREESTTVQRVLRAVWAWFWNRGWREIVGDKVRRWLGREPRRTDPAAASSIGFIRKVRAWLAAASRAGEARLMRYEFVVTRSVAGAPLREGDRLVGQKRLAYIAGARAQGDARPSPWEQLTRLPLVLHPVEGGTPTRAGCLEVDLPYFVQHHATQLQILSQENQPRAIADLLSFFTYLARLLGTIHIWSFRAPNYPYPYPIYEFQRAALAAARRAARRAGLRPLLRRHHRLPGRIAGLRRERFEVPSPAMGLAERAAALASRRDQLAPRAAGVQPGARLREAAPGIRLTRYRSNSQPAARGPVLLIHGLGAGGNTFTLPTVQRNLVQHLAACEYDPWVLDLRTSIGLPASKRDWSFEDVAFGDIPRAIDFIRAKTSQPHVNVVAHCIGAAMFCMAALGGKLPKGSVRAALLSQVGPLLQLPPTNHFRGYLASYLKHYLNVAELDTTADLTPFTRFLDRLLAAYPYPQYEWRAHNPEPPSIDALTHEAYCLRAYGIYGRLFEHENLNEKTLDALGDYLGHIRYLTYQQTIFFATMRRLTDVQGRNAFVTADNIKSHLNFPICLLHGDRNEVFDRRTSRRSFDLLASVFWPDDLAREWRANPGKRYDYSSYARGTRLRLVEVAGYGHQDCLIGQQASERVYPAISRFLMEADSGPMEPAPRAFIVRAPRLGPVLGWLREDSVEGTRRPVARLLFVPNDSRSEPLYAMTIVMRRGRPEPGYSKFRLLRPEYSAKHPNRSRDPNPPTQALDVVLPDATGWEVVVVTVHEESYEAEPARDAGELSGDDPFGEDLDRFPVLGDGPPFPDKQQASQRFEAAAMDRFALAVLETCHDLGVRKEPLPTGRCVADRRYAMPVSVAILSDAALAGRDMGSARGDGSLCFALASCRYAATVVDREAADRSFGRLRDRVEMPPAGARVPQLLFMGGDAIYADATYGIFDPTLGIERYDQRYVEAWTAPNAREVLRRLPMHPMLDDHEVSENFEGASFAHRRRPDLRAGLRAFKAFQLLLTPAVRDTDRRVLGSRGYWYRGRAGAYEYFVADTRTGRSRWRGPGGANAQIMSDDQMADLESWLAAQPRSQPKFIVSPSVVAPWSRETRGDPAYSLRSDAWDGYPRSLERLLGFIARREIRNVVFLSGDYHCSTFCEMQLVHDGQAGVPAYSIVSSGLYAPYPFANARSQDLALSVHESWGGGLSIAYRSLPVDTHSSFAVVAVEREGAGWRLSTEFDAAEGCSRHEVHLS